MISKKDSSLDFYTFINQLQNFWYEHGCTVTFPMSAEVGAGTFNPLTIFNSLTNKPAKLCYLQGCSRPSDGRYGNSPNRLQHFYQLQVLIKPSPDNIIDLYLDSLAAVGINPKLHDIRFVEDNWESPSLGAFGVGWEVWCDGMEISQFTYFQQVGGITPKTTPVEITYGLERILMYILNIDNVYDLPWQQATGVTYGDIAKQNEKEFSSYNFNYANVDNLREQFQMFTQECENLLAENLILPAYHVIAKASHIFNLLDSRKFLGVNDRAFYIQKMQKLVKACCQQYVLSNKKSL